jgi:hypothetical protein
MKEITSAIISSIFKDLSSRRGKVVLIGLAMAAFIVILDLFWLRDRVPSSILKQKALSPLSVTDEIGDKWILDLVKGQQFYSVNMNDRKPGPPLLVSTNIMKIDNRRLSVGIEVKGQAGERYIVGALKNGKREPEPQFIIIDEKARILAKGKFEYG